MSSPTEESSVKRNLITQSSSSYNNKSLDGDIIFVGDYIDLNKTSDACVDLTEESSAKMNNLITQSSNDEEEAKAKRLKEEEEARRIALEDKFIDEERVKGWVKSNNLKGKMWQYMCYNYLYCISSPPCLKYTQRHPNHQTNHLMPNEI